MSAAKTGVPADAAWRVAGLLALACGIVWWLKVALMAADGGSDDSAQVAATYFLGLLTLVVSGGAFSYAASSPWPTWARWLAAAVGAVLAFGVHQAMDVVGDAVYRTDSWFQEESSIWLTASLALVVAVVALVRTRPAANGPS